uniref:Uncharacterized protein n=1 Tax=Echeneis naucrates TaxID=173247 RepID=A0A665U0N7_ECHNA
GVITYIIKSCHTRLTGLNPFQVSKCMKTKPSILSDEHIRGSLSPLWHLLMSLLKSHLAAKYFIISVHLCDHHQPSLEVSLLIFLE